MAGPPGALIARLMQGIVVPVAQRHGELIRHLEPKCARLGVFGNEQLLWAGRGPPGTRPAMQDAGEVEVNAAA